MTDCQLLHENLFAYAEKELPPNLIQQLDKHISECADCSRIVAEFRSVMGLMDEQKSIELRPFTETRILEGIETWMEKRQNSAASVMIRVLRPAIISFGVAAALAIGFFIGSDYADSHSQFSQNDAMIEAVRSDLNVPDFMNDDLFHFTE